LAEQALKAAINPRSIVALSVVVFGGMYTDFSTVFRMARGNVQRKKSHDWKLILLTKTEKIRAIIFK
jgi:uncharacterized protein with von Willebrand factor type A (vWA) domain